MIRRKPAPDLQPAAPAPQPTDVAAPGAQPAGTVASAAHAKTGKSASARAAKRVTPARKGPPLGRSRWQR